MSNKKFTIDDYKRKLGFVAILVGIGLLIVSLYFNQEGFVLNINVTGAPIIGWFLGGAITVIQLVWKNTKMDWKNDPQTAITLTIVGLTSYVYGIWTNVMGLAGTTQIGLSFESIFPVALAIILEIVPEELLLWATKQDDIKQPPKKVQENRNSGNRQKQQVRGRVQPQQQPNVQNHQPRQPQGEARSAPQRYRDIPEFPSPLPPDQRGNQGQPPRRS